MRMTALLGELFVFFVATSALALFISVNQRALAVHLKREPDPHSSSEQKHAKIAKSPSLRILCDLLFTPHEPRCPALLSPT